MRVLSTAAFLAASSFTMMSIDARAADDCGLSILTEVDIVTDEQSGAWAFPVTLGETTKYFLASTGSPFSSINESVVAELGIPTTNTSTAMIDLATGERFNPALARPPEFRIGNLGASDLALQVDRGEGPDGTLGANVLRNYDIEVDFVNRKFFMIDQDHCDGKIQHWETNALTSVPMRISRDNGHIFIDIKVNGVDMEAQISLSTPQTSMNLDIARRRLDVDTSVAMVEEVGQIQTGNRAESIYETTFETIEIGAFTLPHPKMTLMPDMITGQFSRQPTVGTMIYNREEPTRLVDVTLGMSVLRNFHVYLAYGERKLYLSPAVAAVPQTAPQ